MKRLAIFIGGLLVLPAFGEVAPVFYDDIEYTDVVYDEYGNPVYYTDDGEYDLTPTVNETATKPSVSTSRNGSGTRANTNRTTIGRTVPTAATTTATGRGVVANSSRAVAARTTTNASPRSTTNARSVASRGTTSRTTSTGATRTTTNAAASAAAANRATGGAGRASASATRTSSGGASVARTTTTRATATSRGGTTSRVATTGSRVNRAATNAAVAITDYNKVTSAAPVRVTSISGTTGTGLIELNTSNKSLYNSNRVNVASSRVGARVPTIRMTSATGVSTGEVSVTAADLSAMDELAEMTDYCKAQYMACMDNYCNVLDDNQGRCSCSANLKNYANAETALKNATEELQEVAQKIQYIGLSAREVETLFTQTEAELKMQTTTDTSQLKTSLDKIKDMIINVQSGTASSTANSSALSFDLSGLLDFTIDSTGFDLTSFLGGLGTNANSINNQRGAELFKTATNRCKTNVLRACTAAGVDASLITNAYDLEIDKECIIYERALNDSNDQMIATVRNAKNVLQRARLLVEQSKNEYDMRGCINALDACMQDEYVCGSDYEKCLDPSGRYIVNGEIVIGSDPGRAVNGLGNSSVGVLDGDICTMNLYNVWNYSGSTAGQTMGENCTNAWNSYSLNSNNGSLSGYINATLGEHEGLGMSQYIQSKIGWRGTGRDSDRNYGMCMSVLNKCQDYTYTGTGTSRKYNPENEVVRQYLERMLVQIKAKQDEILAEHAESCIADVQSCLSQNGYPFDEENISANSIAANIAINACRSTIVTCMSVNGYSVDNPTPSDLWPWVCGITTGSTDCNPDDQSSGYSVDLYNGATLLGRLYYKNGTWYADNSYSTSITEVPGYMWPTRTGYKIRGFSNSDNIDDVQVDKTSLYAQVVKIDKKFTTKVPGTKLYTAWAKECTNPEHGTCSVNIGSDGSVTYEVSCSNGFVPGTTGTATPTCVQSGNYKITYKCGEHAEGSNWTSESYASGAEVTLPSRNEIRQHCTPEDMCDVRCWKDENSTSSDECDYAQGATIAIDSNMSLKVHWFCADDGRWGEIRGDGTVE